ncbi:hypothetical protein AKO1_007062 [Acrasis kona]|uniref:Transmembrane protein n=1 Tax=Acrasis kona TaxID=1008807 RepID=A0AAW2YVL2_9EUKA
MTEEPKVGTYDRVARPYVLGVASLLLMITTAVHVYYEHNKESFFDMCVVARFDEQKKPVREIAAANTFVFKTSVTVVGVMMLLLVVGNSNRRISRLFQTLFTCGWYYCTWNVVAFLKLFLNDATCNRHANSVSGHFNMYIFALLSLSCLNSRLMTRDTKWTYGFKILFNVLYVAFAVTSGFTLYETVFLGYHSVRQSLYGITIGALSHVVCTELLRFLTFTFDRRSNFLPYLHLVGIIVSYFFSSALLVVIYAYLHQHEFSLFKLIPSALFTILTSLCGYYLNTATEKNNKHP